jgi:hypothetical protein
MEAKRRIKDLAGGLSPKAYTRDEAQRLADRAVERANKKDGF